MMAGCHLMVVADRETTPRRGAPHPPIRQPSEGQTRRTSGDDPTLGLQATTQLDRCGVFRATKQSASEPIRSFKLHCSLAVSAAPQAQADQ